MIQHGICLEAKKAFLFGVHQPGDDYRIAFYGRDAKIGPNTRSYTNAGEITGKGYPIGGVLLKGFKNGMAGKNAYDNATFSASGALIYNASKDGAALCVLNFGAERHVTDGKFELKFPIPTANQALILLA